jgi:hypothetical protein
MCLIGAEIQLPKSRQAKFGKKKNASETCQQHKFGLPNVWQNNLPYLIDRVR